MLSHFGFYIQVKHRKFILVIGASDLTGYKFLHLFKNNNNLSSIGTFSLTQLCLVLEFFVFSRFLDVVKGTAKMKIGEESDSGHNTKETSPVPQDEQEFVESEAQETHE